MTKLLRTSRHIALGLVLSIAGMSATLAADKPDQEGPSPISSIRPAGKIDPASLPSLAKISFDQALAIAKATVPGPVIKGELEVEDGNLMYSFEIVAHGKIVKEVEIDAGNGKVLDVDSD